MYINFTKANKRIKDKNYHTTAPMFMVDDELLQQVISEPSGEQNLGEHRYRHSTTATGEQKDFLAFGYLPDGNGGFTAPEPVAPGVAPGPVSGPVAPDEQGGALRTTSLLMAGAFLHKMTDGDPTGTAEAEYTRSLEEVTRENSTFRKTQIAYEKAQITSDKNLGDALRRIAKLESERLDSEREKAFLKEEVKNESRKGSQFKIFLREAMSNKNALRSGIILGITESLTKKLTDNVAQWTEETFNEVVTALLENEPLPEAAEALREKAEALSEKTKESEAALVAAREFESFEDWKINYAKLKSEQGWFSWCSGR